jgi:autotransporter-associated beta strand protein
MNNHKSPSHNLYRNNSAWTPVFVLAFFCGLLTAPAAVAATDTWTGATSVNWGDANWIGGNSTPQAGDTLAFGATVGTGGATLNDNLGAAFGLAGLIFNPGAAAFTFNASGGSTIATSAGFADNAAGVAETINVPLVLAANQNMTVATGGTLVLDGAISGGAFGVTANGAGTLTLGAANALTGTLAANVGTVNLDFTQPGAPTANIWTASPLSLGGGTLSVVAASSSTAQTFSGTTLASGSSLITTNSASTAASSPTVTLGNITVGNGASVVFNGPATINGSGAVPANATFVTSYAGQSPTTAGIDGILAVAATPSDTFATVGLYDWATTDSTTVANTAGTTVVGGSQVSGFYVVPANNSSASTATALNWDIATQQTAAYSAATTARNSSHNSILQSIRFNTGIAPYLDVKGSGAAFTTTGGLLVTPNMGPINVGVCSLDLENTTCQIVQNNTGALLLLGISSTTTGEWMAFTGGHSSSASSGGLSDTADYVVKSGPGTMMLNPAGGPSSGNGIPFNYLAGSAYTVSVSGLVNVGTYDSINAANSTSAAFYFNGGVTVINNPDQLGQANSSSFGTTAGAMGTVNFNGGTLMSAKGFTSIPGSTGLPGTAPTTSGNFSLIDSADANANRNVFLGNNGGGLAAQAGTTLTVPGVVANTSAGAGPLTIGIPASAANGNTLGLVPGTGGTTKNIAFNATGTVFLTGANTYTGGTILSSGTAEINGINNVGGSGTYGGLTFNGGALQYAASATGNGGTDVSSGAGITLGANGGTVDVNGNTVAFAGSIGGTGPITVMSTAANGVLNLNSTSGSTYSGSTTVASGATLNVNNTSGSGTGSGSLFVNGTFGGAGIVTGNVTINSGGTVGGSGTFSGNVTVNNGGALAGTGVVSGNITVNSGGTVGNGTTSLTSVGGTLTLNTGGTLELDGAATLPVAGLVFPNGSALTISVYLPSAVANGTPVTLLTSTAVISGTQPAVLVIGPGNAGGQDFGLTIGAHSITLTATAAGAVGTWTDADTTGVWSDAANWSGTGTLPPQAAGDLATFGTGAGPVTLDANEIVGGITFNNAASYTISTSTGKVLKLDNRGDGVVINATAGTANKITTAVSLNDAVTTRVNTGDSLALTGNISSTGVQGVSAVGAGTTILSGANTYGPAAGVVGTALSGGGTLQVASGGALSVGDVSIAEASTLQAGAASLSFANNIALADPTTTTLDNNTFGLTLGAGSGVISGSGSITVINSGTLSLGSANTYTGSTTLKGGVLRVSADGAAPGNAGSLGAVPGSVTPNNVVLNGGDLLAPATVALHANRGVGIGATSGSTAGTGLLDAASGATLTVNGIIASAGNTGANALTVNSGTGNTGTVVLSGANTFTGVTLLDQGTLQLNNNNALQFSPLNYTTGTVTIGAGVKAPTLGGLIGTSATQNLPTGSGTLQVIVPPGSETYAGQVSGSGSVVVTTGNGGSLTLGAANYSGSTSVGSNATLTISSGSFGAGGSAITVGSAGNGASETAVLHLTGANATAGNVNIATAANETGSSLYITSGTINFGNTVLGGWGTAGNPSADPVGGAANTAGTLDITGGTVNLGNAYIGRDGGSPGTTSLGLVVNGSGAAVTATLLNLASDAAVNNEADVTVAAGSLTVGNSSSTGAFIVGTLTGSGSNVVYVSGTGSLTYAGTDGVLLGSYSALDIAGGIANLSGVTVNSSAAGGNNFSVFNMTGGAVYLGSVGLVVGAGDTAIPVTLGGTATLGASASWSSAGNIVLSGGLAQIQTGSPTGFPIALSGVLSGSGALNVTGAGTLTLSGVNIYTGGTSNSPTSTLAISSPGDLGAGGVYAGNFTNNGAFTYGSSVAQTLSGVISGTGSLTQSAGTLNLSAVNTYTGQTTVNGGTLNVNGFLAAGSAVAVNSTGILGGSGTINGNVTVNSGGMTLPGPTGVTNTIVGNLTYATGSSNAFDLSASATGAGNDQIAMPTSATTLTGNGVSVYINPTAASLDTVNNYTLFSLGSGVTYASAFAPTPQWVGTPPPNAADYIIAKVGNNVVLENNSTIKFTAVSAAPSSAVLGQTVLLSVTVADSSLPVTGVVATNSTLLPSFPNGAPFTSVGGGVWQLSFVVPNTATAGIYPINLGATDGVNTTLPVSVIVTINAGILWTGADFLSGTPNGNLNDPANWAGGVAPVTANVLYFDNGSGDDPNPLNNETAGFSIGGVVFNAGTVAFDITGNSLTFTGGVTNLSANPQTIATPIVLSGSLTMVPGSPGLSLSGVVSGTGGMIVTNVGVLTLGSANTYTGSTVIGGGQVPVSADGTSGGSPGTLGNVPASATANNVILNGGDLIANATALALEANRGVGIGPTSGSVPGTALIDAPASDTFTINGIIASAGNTGSNNLIINSEVGSTGTVSLGGANTFNGTTTIAAGTLQLNNNLALQNSTLNYSTGTLAFNGTPTAVTLGALSGTSTSQTLTPGTGGALGLTVGGNNSSTTFAGILNETTSLTKSGTGTFTLTGVNTPFTGSITVSAGTLAIGGAGQLTAGTYAGNITDTGTFTYGSSLPQTLSGIISGAGTFNVTGVGAVTSTGVNTFTGATVVGSGATLIFNGATISGTSMTVAQGATPGALLLEGTVSLPSTTPTTLVSGTMNVFNGTATATGVNSNCLVIGASTLPATLLVSPGATFADTTTGTQALPYLGGGVPGSIGIITNAATGTFTMSAEAFRVAGSPNGTAAIYNNGSFAFTSLGNNFQLAASTNAYSYIYDTGTFSVSGLGSLCLSYGPTAGNPGASSTVDVTGSGATLTTPNTGQLQINNNVAESSLTASELNVTAGGAVSVGATTPGILSVNGITNAFASINVSGGSFTTSGASGINLNVNNNASDTNTLTLANGGTIGTSIITNSPLASGTLSLNGGTLMATASPSAGVTAGGLIAANVATYVQAGGATINNGGFSTTIAVALQAPTGYGVASIALSGTTSGYIGAPVVLIAAGTGNPGQGAAAIANFNPSTGTITGITVTSPGSGYTTAPTVTLIGGSATSGLGATPGTAIATATLTSGVPPSGGLTFTGSGGSTALTAVSTYTGATTVGSGTLIISGINNLGDANLGGLIFTGGALQYTAGAAGAGSLDLSSAGGITLTGNGTIDVNGNSVTYANAIGNSGSGGLTVASTTPGGTLTLTAAATYTGATTISGGTLALGVGGSIASSSGVSLGGGATFDVTAVSATAYTLGGTSFTASGDAAATLKIATGGKVNDSLPTTLILTSVSGAVPNPALTVAGGTLVLNDNQFTINGPLLPPGIYTLANSSGTGVITYNATAGDVFPAPTGTAIGWPGTTASIAVSGSGSSAVLALTISDPNSCVGGLVATNGTWTRAYSSVDANDEQLAFGNTNGIYSVVGYNMVNCTNKSGTATVYGGGTVAVGPGTPYLIGFNGGIATAGTPTVLPVGTTNLVLIMTQSTQGQGQTARVNALVVADGCSANTMSFDPISANLYLSQSGEVRIVFNNVSQNDKYVNLQNGTPGLRSARVIVNGTVFALNGLADGASVSVDISRALTGGTGNTVVVEGFGSKGAGAVVSIGETPAAPASGNFQVTAASAVSTFINLPALQITQSGDQTALSWPATGPAGEDFTAYQLQTSASGLPGSWSAAGTAPVSAGGQLTVTVTAGGSGQFYQLADPTAQ